MASDPTGLIREADAALDGITPGPWSTVTSERGQIAVVNAETKFFIALLHPDDQGTEVGESNVRLIADAPDLVRRLRDALRAEQKDGDIIADALDEERAYSAHLRDEVTRAKEWQGIGVATRFAEFREAQRWAEWFAAERDDAQQWSQHFEHEMREAQVSVVQFQQECTAQFPDLDDNCGPDEVASAIHMLRVERNNAFAAIRNMQENNFHREAALAEANATIQRALEACDYLEDGPMQAAARHIRRAIEGES